MLTLNKNSVTINQANIYYNYTIGFGHTNIDLIKTSAKLLKTGITKCVFLSDFKYLYIDENNDIQIDTINKEGRQWDSTWKINFNKVLSNSIVEQLFHAVTLAYHENKLGIDNAKHSRTYVRAELSPLILEDHDCNLTQVYASVKIYSDGIAILSFRLNINDEINEDYFIENVVNIYQRYFKSIWLDAAIQELDAKEILPKAFDNLFSIAGNPISSWKIKCILKKMRKDSRNYLDQCLNQEGQCFQIDDESWILHQIAGSKEDKSSELSIDLCRAQYTNAICGLLVPSKKDRSESGKSFAWVGRPSVSLLRFNNQPASKETLYEKFHPFLSKILGRASEINFPVTLPSDLRPFDDYSFHGNRALLLWTWLRPSNAPENWWDQDDAFTNSLENQARAEQVEYQNMRTQRAASWALSPPSPEHLSHSFKDLSLTAEAIHYSSQAGEITDALTYLMNDFGTTELIPSSKEAARWHLDEMKYKADLKRSQFDRIIALMFGLVGTAGLADFAIEPYIETIKPDINTVTLPLIAFGISTMIVLLVVALVYFFNRPKNL